MLTGTDDVVTTGELLGTGHDGCSGVRPSRLCQAAHRERSQHPPLPDDSSPGGAVQHGERSWHVFGFSSIDITRTRRHSRCFLYASCLSFSLWTLNNEAAPAIISVYKCNEQHKSVIFLISVSAWSVSPLSPIFICCHTVVVHCDSQEMGDSWPDTLPFCWWLSAAPADTPVCSPDVLKQVFQLLSPALYRELLSSL